MIKYLLATWIIVFAAAYSHGMSAVSRDLKKNSSLKCKKAYIELQFQENKI